MSIQELIAKLQEIEAKYPQYSQDTEVVLAIHTNDSFSEEVGIDYIDEVVHKAKIGRAHV